MHVNSPKSRGFIALISALIISAVLLIVAVSGSLTGFLKRETILNSELKDRSAAAADACVDVVRLALADDDTYNGNQTVIIGTDSCEIKPAQNPGGDPRIFPIQGTSHDSYTNYLVSINVGPLTIYELREVPTL